MRDSKKIYKIIKINIKIKVSQIKNLILLLKVSQYQDFNLN